MDSDFIDDFINEYKNQPCLWQASCIDFKNRERRQEAYCRLIDVANKHGLHYNLERTKQKINNLRCAFRHQLKKFTESKNNKGGKEDSYCPKRRYFESLMFLLNEETSERKQSEKRQEPPSAKDDMEVQGQSETYTLPLETEDNSKEANEMLVQPVEEDIQIETHKDNNVHIEVQCDEDGNMVWPRRDSTPKPTETVLHVSNATIAANNVPIETERRARTISMSSHASSRTAEEETAQKKVKIDCSATNFEKLLSLACSQINFPERQEDDFGIFGKMVAYKLRSMDTQQSIIAEKMITDILIEGQMKMLSYPTRTVSYRQDGQAFVISSLNINGAADTPPDRSQHYSTIQYNTGNGSQI